MAKVHFLNVGDGDCSIIQSNSGHITIVDICNGNQTEEPLEKLVRIIVESKKPKGNFRMCENLTNPIEYLKNNNITTIFRFILTHPDMDHMDGLYNLFDNFNIYNFWDSGVRREKPDFESNNKYDENDWNIYEDIISGNLKDLKVISPLAGDCDKYWCKDDHGNGGDYISIISPNKELVDEATKTGNINDGSYVIVYRSAGGNIIFAGDSHNKSWEYILKNYKSLVENASVLFAPHHGRKSDRNHEFLKIVNPKVTFFGCAPSKDLDYSAWQNRNFLYFTNNQCGNVVLEPQKSKINIFIENKSFAEKYTNNETYTNSQGYYFLEEV